MKINRLKRKAAAKVFFFAFEQLNSVNYLLHFNHLEWDLVEGDDLFTPKEKELIKNCKARLHGEAELCRLMGQRLCK
jgi:hypothetical protein